MELYFDPSTAELRGRNLTTGHTVYVALDSDALEEIAGLIAALRVGDANYNAMESLNPWQNQPGGPEPMLVPIDGSDAESASSRGQDGRSKRPFRPLVRKVGDGRASSISPPEFQTYSEGEWNLNCPAMAQSIGEHRLSYLQRRGNAIQQLGQIVQIPSWQLEWRNNKPYVTLEDFRNIHIAAAVEIASVIQKGWQLNIMRATYNMYNCQDPIVILTPHPGEVLPPSGGGGMQCHLVELLYEISFDGGQTWHPFIVTHFSCVPSES